MSNEIDVRNRADRDRMREYFAHVARLLGYEGLDHPALVAARAVAPLLMYMADLEDQIAALGVPMPTAPFVTDEQEAAMFAALTRKAGEPVLRLSKVCNAVRDYARALKEQLLREPPTDKHDAEREKTRCYVLDDLVHRSIPKSGLMARLLYLGEELRTEMCPDHNGKMDTAIWCGGSPACPHGCQGSGWLPNKPKAPSCAS